ncbi:GAF domain-containing protein [Halalkalibacter nanhaiisediminis]|uniref:GAF domain-containing protein n=1 Tax=Halalkalibacter nanhaiisediminis TaxID=688079 RepID=A0A562QJI8_9BACI|nr:GAF domain-containing protein [Halalkalibacter nanhaiisediminis]TWI56948.1 GAF domain-containing protein [Halalkalibacter nanhaiisediminis]
MFQTETYKGTLAKNYELVTKQLNALLTGEKDLIANLANASALLYQFLSDVNWVGFYLLKNEELVLAPFQGLPACVRIPIGKGVCGTAVEKETTLLVEDVHAFPGHIACDAASRSEIVIPIRYEGKIIGILDIDSPTVNRFSQEDQAHLEQFIHELEQHIFI